jgi:hypothetical protein
MKNLFNSKIKEGNYLTSNKNREFYTKSINQQNVYPTQFEKLSINLHQVNS